MNIWGKYRIELYRLLYEHPICKYPIEIDDKKEFNILILGSGYVGDAAFRACLWAGVYPDSKLNITLASQNAEEYKERIFPVLPALKDLTSSGRINLNFVQIDDLTNDMQLSSLDFDGGQYRYVIIALGDHETNFLVGDEVKVQILKSASESDLNFLINIYDENIAKENLEPVCIKNRLNYFGNSMDGIADHELMRRAKNIHFSYTSKYDQRASKKKCDKEFDELFKTEFIESNYEDLMTSFVGANYNADSSLASAVAISSKLYFCSEYSKSDDESVNILMDAVNTKNKLYNKLIIFEHERWVAYMAARGYRMPKPDEYGYIYRHGNNQQTKGHANIGEYFHVCMCDCGEKLFLSNHPELWDMKPQERPRGLAPLDSVSLLCNDIAKQITNEVHAKINSAGYFSILDGKPEFYMFRSAIGKMFRNEDNSQAVYEEALEEAKMVSSEEQKQFLLQLNAELKILKIRNQRIDFFEYDAQLIDMLPFCVWYGNRYSTVITVSDNVLADDVIVPTLLNAPHAIFLGNLSKTSQSIIVDYFAGRGGNTKADFEKIKISIDSIIRKIEMIIGNGDATQFVINCTSTRPEVLLALGKFIDRIPMLKYDNVKGLISYKTGELLCSGLENKNITVQEYIQLCKGEVINASSGSFLNKTDFNALVSLYKDAMKQRQYTKITYEDDNVKESKVKYIPWNLICKFFEDTYKTTKIKFSKKEFDIPVEYTNVFSDTAFLNCRIGAFLSNLLEYRMISDLVITKHGISDRQVSFNYVNPEIAEVLNKYAKNNQDTDVLTCRLAFDPYEGIREANLWIKGATLYKNEEAEELKNSKESLMSRLLDKRLISDLEYVDEEEKSLVSFKIKNDAIAFYLKDKGHLFELVVYEAFHNSGILDDVQTGVRLSWDIDYVSPYEKVKEGLKNRLGFSKSIGFGVLSSQTKIYPKNVSCFTENELDVIAIKGMTPIFVSCKSGASLKHEFIYEIDSMSRHFNAFGALSVFAEADGDRAAFGRRAYQTQISLLDIDIINDANKTKDAINAILNGGVVNGFVGKKQDKIK